MGRKTMYENFSLKYKRAGSVGRLYTRIFEQCMSRKYIPNLDRDGMVLNSTLEGVDATRNCFLGVLRGVRQKSDSSSHWQFLNKFCLNKFYPEHFGGPS